MAGHKNTPPEVKAAKLAEAVARRTAERVARLKALKADTNLRTRGIDHASTSIKELIKAKASIRAQEIVDELKVVAMDQGCEIKGGDKVRALEILGKAAGLIGDDDGQQQVQQINVSFHKHYDSQPVVESAKVIEGEAITGGKVGQTTKEVDK